MNFFVQFRPYGPVRRQAWEQFREQYSESLEKLKPEVNVVAAHSDLLGQRMFILLEDVEPDTLRHHLDNWSRFGEIEVVPTVDLAVMLARKEA